ncbi:MAG: hypothetical protein ACR2GP_05635 [Burkholderiaceae bacterium]
MKLDPFEKELLAAYESGQLVFTPPTKSELAKFKAAASATFIKERRVNIRLASPDLMDIQARAMEEGLPYQTFIASVLHKFVSGKLVERPTKSSKVAAAPSRRAAKATS